MSKINNLEDLLSLDLPNIEFDEDKEIEFELGDWTSLIYSITEDCYYAYYLDIDEGEEYRIPINIMDDNDLPFKDITIQDKKDFYLLIEELKFKGEL